MTVDELKVVLSANNAELMNALKSSERAVESFESAGSGAFKMVGTAATVAASTIAAAGVAMGAGLTVAVTQFVEWEDAMVAVSRELGRGEDAMAIYGAEVRRITLDMDVAGGVMATTAALAEVVGSGFTSLTDSTLVLEAATRAATGTKSDLAKTTDILTKILLGYNLGAEHSGRVTDILAQAALNGKTSFLGLAEVVGALVPQANLLGSGVEDLASLVAFLTSKGLNETEVLKTLKTTLQGLLNPSKELKTLTAGLGFESVQAMVKTLGLAGSLRTLGESGADLEALFPGANAQSFVDLLITQFNDLEAVVHDVAHGSAGAIDDAFDKSTSTNAAKVLDMRLHMEDAFRTLGQNVTPIAGDVATLFMEGFGGGLDTDSLINAITSALQKMVAAFGPAITKVGEFSKTLIEAAPGLIAAFTEIGTIAGPIFDNVLGTAENLWAILRDTGILAAVGAAFTAIGVVMWILSDATESVTGWLRQQKVIVEAVLVVVGSLTVATVLYAAVAGGAAFFTALWTAATIALNTALAVLGLVSWPVVLVVAAIAGALVGVYYAFKNWDAIVLWFSATWKQFTFDMTYYWNAVWSWLGGLKDSFVGIFAGAGSWLFNIGRQILQGLWNGLKDIWVSVQAWWNDKMDKFGAYASEVLGIQSPSKVFEDIGRNVVLGFRVGLDGLGSSLDPFASSVNALPSGAGGGGGSVVNLHLHVTSDVLTGAGASPGGIDRLAEELLDRVGRELRRGLS